MFIFSIKFFILSSVDYLFSSSHEFVNHPNRVINLVLFDNEIFVIQQYKYLARYLHFFIYCHEMFISSYCHEFRHSVNFSSEIRIGSFEIIKNLTFQSMCYLMITVITFQFFNSNVVYYRIMRIIIEFRKYYLPC